MTNQLLSSKHQPSGTKMPKLSPQLPFESYIKETQEQLEQGRIDLNQYNRARIISANSPFQWYPENFSTQEKRRGILLVHGMLESPFSLWDFGKHFLNLGFAVKAILLPGHGTVPGDLLTIKHKQWQETVEYGIASLEKEVDEVFLLGFSAGACLSLLSAFSEPSRLAGLFLFSPMIQLKTKLALLANVMHGIGNVYKPAQWYKLADDLDYAKYESFPYQTIHQAYLLTQEIKKQSHRSKLNMPVFMAISRDDETIDCFAAEQFLLQQPSERNQLIIYSNDSEPSFDHRITYRSSHYPEEKILHFSHVCLQISPDNDHYGRQGDYRPTLNSHKATPYAEESFHGALTKDSLSEYYLRRLTYNPDFPFLLDQITKFVDEI